MLKFPDNCIVPSPVQLPWKIWPNDYKPQRVQKKMKCVYIPRDIICMNGGDGGGGGVGPSWLYIVHSKHYGRVLFALRCGLLWFRNANKLFFFLLTDVFRSWWYFVGSEFLRNTWSRHIFYLRLYYFSNVRSFNWLTPVRCFSLLRRMYSSNILFSYLRHI